MIEETFSRTPIEKPKKDWLKIIAFSLVGLILLSGTFYAGYWCGIRKSAVEPPMPVIPISLDEPRTTKSEKIPSDIPEELKCEKDRDCEIDFCKCEAVNKKYLDPEGKICLRVCNKTPICYQNRCVFKGEENKYRIEIE